ncbi:hypothetical protein RRF57_013058 [Xylaria bambusicola]|uniref:Uncharacterized protein n=1 Tax=Xylaria bambusicola TaxID=326684 RepID=A0AAN7V195_9PEZI
MPMTSETQLSGRRIHVIGAIGAGKSTFARRLGKQLSIPVLELDSLFRQSRAGGALSEDDARRTVQAVVESNDEWILDGRYGVAVPLRHSHRVQLKDISYSIATDILCEKKIHDNCSSADLVLSSWLRG